MQNNQVREAELDPEDVISDIIRYEERDNLIIRHTNRESKIPTTSGPPSHV